MKKIFFIFCLLAFVSCKESQQEEKVRELESRIEELEKEAKHYKKECEYKDIDFHIIYEDACLALCETMDIEEMMQNKNDTLFCKQIEEIKIRLGGIQKISSQMYIHAPHLIDE